MTWLLSIASIWLHAAHSSACLINFIRRTRPVRSSRIALPAGMYYLLKASLLKVYIVSLFAKSHQNYIFEKSNVKSAKITLKLEKCCFGWFLVLWVISYPFSADLLLEEKHILAHGFQINWDWYSLSAWAGPDYFTWTNPD